MEKLLICPQCESPLPEGASVCDQCAPLSLSTSSPSVHGEAHVTTVEKGGLAVGVLENSPLHQYFGPVYQAASGSNVASPSLDETRNAYLAYLIECFDGVEPKGIPQTVRSVRLPLEEIYVSLAAEREISSMLEPEPFALIDRQHPERARDQRYVRLPEKRSEPVDLPRVVRESPRAVILGDPGAGKSTLMRFLAVRFAKALQSNEMTVSDRESAQYGEVRLPILLRVADYADAFRKDSAPHLRAFLPRAFGDIALPQNALATLFEDTFQNGRALVLLDGLDEIADAGRRSDIARSIDGFVSGMGNGNRIIVTSRIAGYQEARLGSGFQQYTLRDMEREQIERFLNRWCTACERFHHPQAGDEYITNQAKKQIQGLLAAVDKNQGVRQLATNPLLLTILALIHRNGGRLPERRIQLYKIATETLLRDWRLAQAGAEAREVTEHEAEGLLAPLAYWMHENEPTGLIEDDVAHNWLCQYYAKARNMSPSHPDVKTAIDDFLRRVREHTGLFIERAPGKYGFMHLTFEEYFAALYMVNDFTKAADKIRGHRHQTRWEEPIRLAIATKSASDAATLIRASLWDKNYKPPQPVVKAGHHNPPKRRASTKESVRRTSEPRYTPSKYEDILRRDLLLTARCLGDCTSCEPTLAIEMAHELTTIYLQREKSDCFVPLEKVYPLLPTFAKGEIGQEIQRLLVSALKDPEEGVRRSATEALGKLGNASEAVITALISALKDPDNWVRVYATEALGQLGNASEAVITALISALKDPDDGVRSSAWLALETLVRD